MPMCSPGAWGVVLWAQAGLEVQLEALTLWGEGCREEELSDSSGLGFCCCLLASCRPAAWLCFCPWGSGRSCQLACGFCAGLLHS